MTKLPRDKFDEMFGRIPAETPRESLGGISEEKLEKILSSWIFFLKIYPNIS